MTYYYVLVLVILYRFLCTTVFKRRLQLMKNAVDWTRSLKDWAVATIKDSTPTLMYVLIIQAWKMVGLTFLTICFNSMRIDATYFSVSLFVKKKSVILIRPFSDNFVNLTCDWEVQCKKIPIKLRKTTFKCKQNNKVCTIKKLNLFHKDQI